MKNMNFPSILLADDDIDDCQIIKEAFEDIQIVQGISFVHSGEDLLDHLYCKGQFSKFNNLRPDLILLDLNMPKKDGFEVLQEIKSHPDFKQIPIVILTTSDSEEDISRSYNLGASSYITKPVAFDDFAGVLKGLVRYWFEVVSLPRSSERLFRSTKAWHENIVRPQV